jgi:uncharacterized protein YdeI (YjbR/CyaY-like superfamily)
VTQPRRRRTRCPRAGHDEVVDIAPAADLEVEVSANHGRRRGCLGALRQNRCMAGYDDAERVEPAAVEGWSAWLAEHHDDATGVWLVTPRRASARSFDYETAVCEALRYGWVDAVQKPLDEERTMQWFAPRRPTSGWSRPNKLRIERLERDGRLEPAGRATVEAAKANGTWTLLDDVEDLVVPDDLAAAFEAHRGARAAWDGFSRSSRKQMLTWVVTAKKPETRARRIEEIAAKAAEGVRAKG